MNYEQFAIWLHGFLEISNAETIDKQQTQIIKDHLALLFEKKTPDRIKKKEEDTPTGSPFPDLVTFVSDSNPCEEISLGKQFEGVDMQFDAEAHKTKKCC